MARQMAKDKSKDSGLGAEAKDVVNTLRDYAKQETLGPLKGLGTYLAWGVAGAICMGIACLLIMLGLLRVLQNETGWFDNNLSFLPYLFVILALTVVLAVTVRAVTKEGSTN